MDAVISEHPKGVRIQLNPLARNMGASRLRRILGVPVTVLPGNAYLVSLSALPIVLQYFDPAEAIWDEQLLSRALAAAKASELQLRARMEVEYALANARSILRTYSRLGQLDDHQIQAVAAIVSPSLQGIAIFDEQGTGKTLMALAAFDHLYSQGSVKRLLVVAPKSILGAWRQECERLFGGEHRVVLATGSAAARRKLVQQPHEILLMSYENLVSDIELVRLLVGARSQMYMLVIDESYFVKNPDASRSKAIAEIRPFCQRAVVLCGTPAPNDAIDVVNQINLADGGIAFRSMSLLGKPQEARKQVEERLGNTIFLRRLKEHVLLDIPRKEIVKVVIPLAPTQQQLYSAARDELLVTVKNMEDKEFTRQLGSFLARRAALLQICSHPGAINALYDEVPAKHTVLDDLVKNLILEGKKVVIWSYFRYSLQSLVERYNRYGVARIDGSVPTIEERMTAINKFQQDPEIRLFIGNAAAAGAGITLTAAHHAIYESFSNQGAHYMQSIDRIHRRGQTHDVTYHVLLTQGTIEEKEFDRLLEKERRGRELLGDRYEEPMTRERFLAELEEAEE